MSAGRQLRGAAAARAERAARGAAAAGPAAAVGPAAAAAGASWRGRFAHGISGRGGSRPPPAGASACARPSACHAQGACRADDEPPVLHPCSSSEFRATAERRRRAVANAVLCEVCCSCRVLSYLLVPSWHLPILQTAVQVPRNSKPPRLYDWLYQPHLAKLPFVLPPPLALPRWRACTGGGTRAATQRRRRRATGTARAATAMRRWCRPARGMAWR